jgi:hypothetical protein
MMRRGIGRRGPGLIGTAARTAVVAGTATAVSGNVARRQHARAVQANEAAAYEQQAAAAQAPPPPPPAPAPAAAAAAPTGQELIDQLSQLGALKDQGILTEEEFAAQKARLLGG